MRNVDILMSILMSDDVLEEMHSKERLLFKIIPELTACKGFDQKSDWHCYDVWEHTIHSVASCDKDPIDRLALLLHDIGKPHCFQDNGNVRRFKGHAQKSAEMARPILKRLGVGPLHAQKILFLIRNHATSIDDVDFENDELLYIELLKIQMCDASAYEPDHARSTLMRLRTKKNYSIIQ